MNIEISTTERDVIKRVLTSYLSELRVEIRETKGDKTSLHEEENLIKRLLERLANL
jgi:hypothetical protein